MLIRDAIETIEDYNELLPQDLERIMNAAIEKCNNPSVCRDFINALCERESKLQDEGLIKVTQDLEKALENYFAAGCSLGIDFNCCNMQDYCNVVDLDDSDEYFHVHAIFNSAQDLNYCIELPYA